MCIRDSNYGNLEGMPEARRFFADILGAQPDEVIVGGNSSLNMMYYLIDLGSVSYTHLDVYKRQHNPELLASSGKMEQNYGVSY